MNIQEITNLLLAISAVFGAIMAVLGYLKSAKTQKSMKLLEVAKKNEVQDNQITEILDEIKDIKKKLAELQTENKEISEFIEELKNVRNFKGAILDVANRAISTNEHLSNDFKSLIIEGAEVAATFFTNAFIFKLYKEPKLFEISALSQLRGLRSGTGNNQNFPNPLKDAIKSQIAYPLIARMKAAFMKIENTDDLNSYSVIVIVFIENFIYDSIKLVTSMQNHK